MIEKIRKRAWPLTAGRKLKSQATSQAALAKPPDTNPDENGHAVLVVTTEVPDEHTMIETSQLRLKEAVDTDQLVVENIRGDMFVGNIAGMEYAQAKADSRPLRDRTKALEESTKALQEEVQQLKIRVEHTDMRMMNMEASIDGFRDFRNRFISTYKRDKLSLVEESDHWFIRSGNRFAHEGNFKRDAELYEGMSGRKDDWVFTELYGIDPATVRKIGRFPYNEDWKILTGVEYPPTIQALNRHATVLASEHQIGTSTFRQLFAEFIEALTKTNFPNGYLEKEIDTPSFEYWAFMACLRQEIHTVQSTLLLLRVKSHKCRSI
jgi:hypothetical protein